ncbi:RAD9, HUS1, RAD1-interacting nuclear orphan protein 1 isoform X1 [Misgurnus anguillicaudatus]|uniref:RAD9, HUS1, RAD1-interacting nuclear orphan protein 1 isoform X1 n=1 Tax=Misgurnus anguillicaudatus TaxID=75329 RepID=UPI003CCF8C2E
MPRASRKKRLLTPNKSQLFFKEAPINGPKHDCGPQLRSAIYPRTFISDKQQRGGAPCISWVSPQFSSHDIKAVSRGNGKNLSTTRNKSNTVSGLSSHHDRRRAVSKYAPLSFETNREVSQHLRTNRRTKTSTDVAEEVRCSRGRNYRPVTLCNLDKGTVETPKRTRLRKEVKRSTAASVVGSRTEVTIHPPVHKNGKRTFEAFGSQTPNTSSALAPPEVETPEMPHCFSASLPSGIHLLFPPNQAKTPPHTPNTNVLVKDTPEKDYGLRVTWRRRKGLMKLLIDSGKLLLRDAEVANEWL